MLLVLVLAVLLFIWYVCVPLLRSSISSSRSMLSYIKDDGSRCLEYE